MSGGDEEFDRRVSASLQRIHDKKEREWQRALYNIPTPEEKQCYWNIIVYCFYIQVCCFNIGLVSEIVFGGTAVAGICTLIVLVLFPVQLFLSCFYQGTQW